MLSSALLSSTVHSTLRLPPPSPQARNIGPDGCLGAKASVAAGWDRRTGVMAAGTNRKRPWEARSDDEEQRSYGHAQPVANVAAYQGPRYTQSPAASVRPETFPSHLPSVDERPGDGAAAHHGSRSASIDEAASKRPKLRSELSHGTIQQATPPWIPNADGRRYSHVEDPNALARQGHGAPHVPGLTSIVRPSQETPRESSSTSNNAVSASCEGCGSLRPIVNDIVSKVFLLDAELRHGLARGVAVPPMLRSLDIDRAGIPNALQWVSKALHIDVECARQITWGTTHQRPYSSDVHGSQLRGSPPELEDMKRKIETLERERDEARRGRSRFYEDHAQTPNSESRSTFVSDGERRMSMFSDSGLPSQSPHVPTIATSNVPPHSPGQASTSTRMLPTPSSLNFPSTVSTSLPSISPSTQATPSAHAAHFQDLQHQVSTKTLALQTLQREHDSRLRALLRSRDRCIALEKKFQVSDAEINRLTEERISLQAQVDGLECQVEDLVNARDEARRESVANNVQYMSIVSRASQLEQQGAADKRRLRVEKEELNRRVAQLEREQTISQEVAPLEMPATSNVIPVQSRGPALSPPHAGEPTPTVTSPIDSVMSPGLARTPHTGPPTSSDSNDVLHSNSLDDLRAEINRLRRSCASMESTLLDLRQDGARIDSLLHKLSGVSREIHSKADSASAAVRLEAGIASSVEEDPAEDDARARSWGSDVAVGTTNRLI
ncbi:MAG: hypothetical protein M1833_004974 [Piccolia ochrophora]|nr:MAG: hypothetical protein M1833_004974 [Piccolia ochrophora]